MTVADTDPMLLHAERLGSASGLPAGSEHTDELPSNVAEESVPAPEAEPSGVSDDIGRVAMNALQGKLREITTSDGRSLSDRAVVTLIHVLSRVESGSRFSRGDLDAEALPYAIDQFASVVADLVDAGVLDVDGERRGRTYGLTSLLSGTVDVQLIEAARSAPLPTIDGQTRRRRSPKPKAVQKVRPDPLSGTPDEVLERLMGVEEALETITPEASQILAMVLIDVRAGSVFTREAVGVDDNDFNEHVLELVESGLLEMRTVKGTARRYRHSADLLRALGLDPAHVDIQSFSIDHGIQTKPLSSPTPARESARRGSVTAEQMRMSLLGLTPTLAAREAAKKAKDSGDSEDDSYAAPAPRSPRPTGSNGSRPKPSVPRSALDLHDEAADKGWQERANCTGVDPDLFFPERGASTKEAKGVCNSCEVRMECLEYALRHGEKFGIWGGMSERERRRLRRQRSLARQAAARATE